MADKYFPANKLKCSLNTPLSFPGEKQCLSLRTKFEACFQPPFSDLVQALQSSVKHCF